MTLPNVVDRSAVKSKKVADRSAISFACSNVADRSAIRTENVVDRSAVKTVSIRTLSSLLLLVFVACTTPTTPATKAALKNDAIERSSKKGPVTLVIRLSPSKPRLSDTIQLEIEVTAEPKVEIQPPSFGQSVGDFLVRDYSERYEEKRARKKEDAETANKRRFQYQLEPVRTGPHLIRAVAIDFIDNRPESENVGKLVTIESEPMELEVTSELGDQVPNLANLEPMIPPRPIGSNRAWLWWLLFVPIGLLLSFILWSRRRKGVPELEPIRRSPAEIAQEAFVALLAENLPAQRRFQEFYLRLTGIVRHYIEGTTGIRAPDQTTEEFLQAIRSRAIFQGEQSQRLKEFLEAADMVKYAGQEPNSDQIELSIARAREFVSMRSANVPQWTSNQSPTPAHSISSVSVKQD